jgi:glycosyltransferase involved in cell wall biosynthesis
MLSIAIITLNEERNLERTLESVRALAGEIVVVDCGSTDDTLNIARRFGAKVYSEEWKGYGTQKNSAIAKCSGEWVLSLDADESVTPELAAEIAPILSAAPGEGKDALNGYFIPRKNYFLGRWIKQGGFWPDPKIRLFRRGAGQFEERQVHETMQVSGRVGSLHGALSHDTYPTLEGYLNQMNRYSSLGAQMAVAKGKCGFNPLDIVMRPGLTFLYNYFLRLGFLDGKEGLLLHLYHACYVSWKYAKVWEASRARAK